MTRAIGRWEGRSPRDRDTFPSFENIHYN
jgi:hypothetical protein